MTVYKLEFKVRVSGYYDNNAPVSVGVETRERKPPQAKYDADLELKAESSYGFTWLRAEAWKKTEFSNEEIYDYLAEFRDLVYELTSTVNANVAAEPIIQRYYE